MNRSWHAKAKFFSDCHAVVLEIINGMQKKLYFYENTHLLQQYEQLLSPSPAIL